SQRRYLLVLRTTLNFSYQFSRTGQNLLNATSEEGNKVLGGKPCLPNSQPWQAALFSGFRLICGGTLIHPSWVVSAAHCRKSSIFPVRLGEHHLRRIDWSEQLKLSSKAIVHPEFNRRTLNNDIMMIKLLTPATLNDKVKVLDLSTNCPEPGTKCLISGWGTTSSPQSMHPLCPLELLNKRLQC
uniref:Peptidase S1 domain-containing protein n=1 Tax=Pseudonaja textilis TaxID=8673 RepID=A0A670YP62_PSETE